MSSAAISAGGLPERAIAIKRSTNWRSLRSIVATYNNRGVARGKSGDNKGAIADYKKAVELYPNDNPLRQRTLDEIKKLQE